MTCSSDELNELAKALSAAQGEFPAIPKSHTGKIQGEGKRGAYEYTYHYADLADTVAAAQPILTTHGLSVAQFPEYDGVGEDLLTTRVMHESGQWLESSMRLLMAKQDPQGQGSAISYARRYAYCAALGIVADEDDDGQAASQPAAKPRTVRQPPGLSGETRDHPQADENGEVVTTGGKPVTPKQLDFIHKLAEERGLRGADLKDYTQMVLERDVAKMAEITAAEASTLIDALKNVPVDEEPAG